MTLSSFSAVLAVLVLAVNAATVVVAQLLLRRDRPSGLVAFAGRFGVPVAAVAAVAASAASLLLSERYGLPPCRLCWYQRYAMYPLGALLAVAAVTRRRWAGVMCAATAAAGLAVAGYHTLVERFPSLESGACEVSNPCSVIWFQRFGFVTIPYGAGSVFAFTLVMLWAARRTRRLSQPH